MKKLSLFFVLLLALTVEARSQLSNVAQLEVQLKKGIANAYAASVRIWGFDTVRKVQNSSQFSGVVVDKDGTILTVSHAIQPNRTYKVRFPDGREAMAVALGRMGLAEMQTRPDLGMMKLIGSEQWPFAQMGWSSSLKVDEPCLSISYPETLNQMLPTVRFGRIMVRLNETGFIQSTCKMEPGDSGGPLFDYMGRVVGIHSRCLNDEDGNFEVPINAYRKYWTSLKTAVDYKSLPLDTDKVVADPLANQIVSVPLTAHLEDNFSNIASYIKKSAINLFSEDGIIEQRVWATVFDVNGRNYAVSKSSLVHSNAWFNENGQKQNVRVLARDQAHDLVLLELPNKMAGALSSKALKNLQVFDVASLGGFLLSPIDDGLRVSILSSMAINMPLKFSAGFFGASSSFREGKVRVTRITRGAPAEKAGLKAGDEIEWINDMPISSAEYYNAQMAKYMPGESIVMKINRDGQSITLNVQLGVRPLAEHAADKFKGGKSIRLDGFEQVFVHDAVIQPQECGGPVFDKQGNFYGINIARFSRTSVVAVPTKIISAFIENTLNVKPIKKI